MINVTVLSLLLCVNFPRGKMKCDFFTLKKQAKQHISPEKQKQKQNTKTPPKIP